MFARTFGIRTKDIDLDDPKAVIGLIEQHLGELSGKKPYKFAFFADCDREHKKLIFFDTTAIEHVVEFSSIFSRLPEYSVECDGKSVKIYHFHPENAVARVIPLSGDPIGPIAADEEASRKETASLLAVASTTDGFLDTAVDLAGVVVATIVENDTKEKRPCFTVKIDAKSPQNRSILRSCEQMFFAWSDMETSYMILMCRFKMLPPFALAFPLMGRNIDEAAELYMDTKKGVGMVMFTDDVSDSFQIENGRPTFE